MQPQMQLQNAINSQLYLQIRSQMGILKLYLLLLHFTFQFPQLVLMHTSALV
jgi:hypothetical protein